MNAYTIKQIGTEHITVEGFDYEWPVSGLFLGDKMVASELGYGDYIRVIRDRGYINNNDKSYPAKDHIRWA